MVLFLLHGPRLINQSLTTYRLIFLFSFAIVKVLYIYSFKFQFTLLCSTETNLVKVAGDLHVVQLKNQLLGIILFDLSAAFGPAYHSPLCDGLFLEIPGHQAPEVFILCG